MSTLEVLDPHEETEALTRWLEHRRQGIGGSDAPAVIGENPYKSPLALYCDKLGIGEEQPDNEKMEWGRLLEPVVADKYARATKRQIIDPGRFAMQWSTDHPFMFATLDRFVIDPERGEGLLEVKTTGAQNADDWEGQVPRMPWVQLQHQLAVTGKPWGSLAVLIGGNTFRWMDVERDEAFIALLIEEEAKFWRRVQLLDPPQPDGSWATKKALDAMFPEDDGSFASLGGEFIDADLELLTIKEDLKQLGLRKDAIENQIKAALGAAAVGVLPNGVKYTYKTQRRAGYVVEPTSFRALRRSAK